MNPHNLEFEMPTGKPYTAKQDTHALSTAKESSFLHIAAIKTNSKTLLRLMGLGLVTGEHIEVLRNRRGDVVLGNGNCRISLGRSVAEKIMVHEVAAIPANEVNGVSV